MTKHFWVASGPFLESYFMFLASPDLKTSVPAKLDFFDADGALVNESELSFAPGQPSVFPAGQFLGSCKTESGIRHAHCILTTDSLALFAVTRIVSGSSATIFGEPDTVSGEKNSFAPVVFSPIRQPLLCVLNESQEEIHLRCQLFLGSRVPEAGLIVAPFGARLLALDVEFEQSLPKEVGKTVRAYVRLGLRGGGTAGIQLLETYANARNEQFVSAVG